MVSKTNRKLERDRRHKRVRTKVSGTAERPRLCVYRSNTNLYAQVIDDVAGNTLVSASTLDKEIKTKKSNIEAAKEVGALIAKRAAAKKEKKIMLNPDIDKAKSLFRDPSKTVHLQWLLEHNRNKSKQYESR